VARGASSAGSRRATVLRDHVVAARGSFEMLITLNAVVMSDSGKGLVTAELL
jgi:hypothetical protein